MNPASGQIALRREDGVLTAWAGDLPIAVVDSGERMPPLDAPRPFLHPLRTLAGGVVSDDAPLDHPWHHGLSLAIANVTLKSESRGVNFWGGPTFLDGEYRALDNLGRQVVVRDDPDRESEGIHAAELEWRTARNRSILRESRRLWFSYDEEPSNPGWTLEWWSELRNVAGEPIGFGSPTTAGRPAAGYGGLFLRAGAALQGAEILLDGEPVDEARAMGSRGARMTLRGGGVAVSMTAIGDDPETPWFVRTAESVMLCAAPFFDAVVELPAQAAARWGWRLEVRDDRRDV